jgi:adhesin transport system membrane fusion protein
VNVFTIGGVVKPGMDLVEIVPNKEELVIEAELPVSEVGFVNTDQKVVVRLMGNHSSQYEALEGRVTQVSPDTIRKEEGKEFYQVKIATNSDHFVDGLNRYELRPGLLVDCRFVVLERTLLENLIAPIIATTNRAFSENVWTSSDERSKWVGSFSQIIKYPLGKSG